MSLYKQHIAVQNLQENDVNALSKHVSITQTYFLSFGGPKNYDGPRTLRKEKGFFFTFKCGSFWWKCTHQRSLPSSSSNNYDALTHIKLPRLSVTCYYMFTTLLLKHKFFLSKIFHFIAFYSPRYKKTAKYLYFSFVRKQEQAQMAESLSITKGNWYLALI